jgi:sugar/nucleoside kinase (ribokinase family)
VSTALLSPLPPPRRFDLLAVGECSLDTRLLVSSLPAPGEKRTVLQWEELAGGQTASAALAAARLGLRVAYAGAVGDDACSESVLAPLRAAGVDLGGVVRVPGAATRAAVILVEEGSGERTILGHRDPALGEGSARLAGLDLGTARLLLLDGSDLGLATRLAARARAAGQAVVLDLDGPTPGFEELLAHVDFPVVSRDFAVAAYGSAGAALERLIALGARMAVVTLGAEGASARIGESALHSPAFEVPVVDTTGAGDTFHAAFAWALLAGQDARQALRWANAAAALSCTAAGAQGARLDGERVRALLARRADQSS